MREGDGGLRALERSAQPLALVRPQLLLPELHRNPRVVRRRQSGAYAADEIARWRNGGGGCDSEVWGVEWGHSGKISGAGSVSATAEIAVFRLSFEDTVERIKGVALSVSAALSASPMVVIPWRICCQREGRDSSVVSLELHSSIDRFTSSNRECGFTIRLVFA